MFAQDGHCEVVLVNLEGDPNTMYSSPRVDPTGTFLCWIQWQHPNMVSMLISHLELYF